jgi:hypothetical protein
MSEISNRELHTHTYIHTYIHEQTNAVVVVVFLGFRGKPRMYCSLAGLLYRPIWTFQLWRLDASAPADAPRTPVAEVGTYGRGNEA